MTPGRPLKGYDSQFTLRGPDEFDHRIREIWQKRGGYLNDLLLAAVLAGLPHIEASTSHHLPPSPPAIVSTSPPTAHQPKEPTRGVGSLSRNTEPMAGNTRHQPPDLDSHDETPEEWGQRMLSIAAELAERDREARAEARAKYEAEKERRETAARAARERQRASLEKAKTDFKRISAMLAAGALALPYNPTPSDPEFHGGLKGRARRAAAKRSRLALLKDRHLARRTGQRPGGKPGSG